MNKKIFLLVSISSFLLLNVLGAWVNASVTAFSDVARVEENHLTTQKATDLTSSGSIEFDQAIAGSFQENLTGTFQGGSLLAHIPFKMEIPSHS